MTGVRLGIILEALSAIVTGLAIGFSASWKLTLVTLCFAPVISMAGKFRNQNEGKAGKSKEKGSFTEQGGQV